MAEQRKFRLSVSACASALLFVMLAAVVLAPRIINSKTVRNKLRSDIKTASGFDVDFKHLRLNFFPRPHATIEQVAASIPGVRMVAAALTLHPRILSLIRGKLQITRLRLDSAELDYILPIKPATMKSTRQPVSLGQLGKKIGSFLSTLPEFNLPNLDFQLVDSRVNLFDQKRKFLSLNAVNAHMNGPPEGRTISIEGASNLWRHILVNTLLNTRNWKGNGQIKMTYFQPQDLAAYLFPDGRFQAVEGAADLTIDFKIGELEQLEVALQGSIPYANLRYAEQALNIKNTRIKAAFQIDNATTILSLTQLAADDPRLNVFGHLTSTRNSPHLNLQMEGSHIDVAAARRLVLLLAGKNTAAKKTFDVLKDGNIPQITLKAQGNTLRDLVDLDRMVIKGQLQDGEIHVPDIDIDLKETTGAVVISKGVLGGKNMQTRLGKTTAKKGQLKLGIVKGAAPFHLETDVQMDLSQLVPILRHLVKDKKVRKQVALIQSLKGSANGKLIIDEEKQGTKVKVDDADIKVTQVDLCGVSMSGTGTVSQGVIDFGLDASATDQSLEKTLACFEIDALKADGDFRLNGKFQGHGKIDHLFEAISGNVDLSVPGGGRIYHSSILLNVLKFFNTLELLDGQVNVGDMGTKGFLYHSYLGKATLKAGELRFKEMVLRGQPMTITAVGTHGIQNRAVDMNLLVAPLVSLDRFFDHIPLIGRSVETLDAFPLGVRGTMDNIHIYPLAPSAIGFNLTETMKALVGRPIKFRHIGQGLRRQR